MNGVIRLKFSTVCKTILFFPCAALFSCVSVALIFHWEEATSTHCKVQNILPSLSSAIGGFTPERYIWRLFIALHSFGRFTVALVYLYFYKQLSSGKKSWIFKLAVLNFVLNSLEILSLLVLSYVSSIENFDVHEGAFICYIIFSIAYMLDTCVLLKTLADEEKSEKLFGSFKLKSRLLIAYVICFAMSVYFYFRHNGYCEPGVYSLFAICEYMVVLLNIGFHMTALSDFNEAYVTIGPLLTPVENVSEKYR